MPLPDEIATLAAEVSNWGRWGDDDELGCGNLLSAESTRRGTAAVRDGRRISLAAELKADGIQVGQPARRYNPILTVTSLNERDKFAPGIWEGTDDLVTMSTCAGTHVDALSHVSYDGFLYNGVPTSAVTAQYGASKLGAEKLPPIVTRGLLLDVARAKGVDSLDEISPGYAITAEDLDAAAELVRVTPAPGDVILVRTGQMRHYHAGDRQRYTVGTDFSQPGLSVHTIGWIHRHDLAGAFVDTYAYEAFPPTQADWSDCLAVHLLQIRDMGLLQGQNWDLEELADACAERGSGEVLLVAAPEPLVGATSAPVAPVAVL
ncbi:MAG TPA: cyclase family protein [Microthrixaceae bacterium]|nr:cyclase family protein [Microthrixaceae bacterium]HMY88264.1 cyclase family protein [Microthrixaceae bacterium]HNA37084.1 cyclase family protein [Microthrixaceae bacterium]HNB95554.1 cyclase family protein [Microthrixaceae bacterium]HNE36225.1 cyclase family protein [Microthrixaceae bacterium]